MPTKATPPYERMMARTAVQPGGCITFQGALSHGGYGIVQLGRGVGTDRAHRIAYRHHKGEIPDGMTIDHICRNPACVNPDHLEVVTRDENTRRQWDASPPDPARYLKTRTACVNGHEFTPENTYMRGTTRICRACARSSYTRRTPEQRDRYNAARRARRAASKD